jgi:hypothetical protein
MGFDKELSNSMNCFWIIKRLSRNEKRCEEAYFNDDIKNNLKRIKKTF